MRFIISSLILAFCFAVPGFGGTIIFEDDLTDAGAFDASNWNTFSGAFMRSHAGLTLTGLDDTGTDFASSYEGFANEITPELTGPFEQVWSVNFLLAFEGPARSFGFELIQDSFPNLGRSMLTKIEGGKLYSYSITDANWMETGITGLVSSLDANNDHDFADMDDTLHVYSVTFSGDYSGATPTYDISFTDSVNGVESTQSVTGLSYFFKAPESLGAGNGYSVPTGIKLWNNQDVSTLMVFDEVTISAGTVEIPEPSTIILFLSSVVALSVWRRRRA